MTDTATPRLLFPLLQPGQAQKEMFHNAALALLDMNVQPAAVAAGTNVPPEAPEAGDCWIVGAAPTDEWAGHAHAVAGWTSSGWQFVSPREGAQFWLGAAQGVARFIAGAWRVGETHGKLFVEGDQVVGSRGDPIAEPAGGTTVDAEARAVIVSVLEALRTHGLIESG
ncbi:hypothetical protein FHS95_003334 [Sphingomonas naasensis]|uniref:DUF2793 domain-containing protein n=1 Tax=Sphingomonas naasensis TaxID=1344951 RepID=A0A4S1WFP2_9SPHN|nr:DUF2793 domain-containing protein [Sphingomonas naasensis]NIJ21631.1 hypothetical protein [Sphingomonas naasensis]TGX41433.1 DUF2793 domain-containing protein [Sphingomonas naasensis]